MNKFYIIVIFFGLISCGQNKDLHLTTDSKSLKEQLIDSIYKYSELSEAKLTDDSLKYSVIIKTINKTKIATLAITDSVLFLFVKNNSKWILSDSIEFDTYANNITIIDLNNDKRSDFIINGHSDNFGNIPTSVFLSLKDGTFKYRHDLSLLSLQFDEHSNLFRSSLIGSVYSLRCKELYKWNNDSLILVRGAKIDPDKSENNIVQFYTVKKNKECIYLKLKDENKTISIYDTALWVGEY